MRNIYRTEYAKMGIVLTNMFKLKQLALLIAVLLTSCDQGGEIVELTRPKSNLSHGNGTTHQDGDSHETMEGTKPKPTTIPHKDDAHTH